MEIRKPKVKNLTYKVMKKWKQEHHENYVKHINMTVLKYPLELSIADLFRDYVKNNHDQEKLILQLWSDTNRLIEEQPSIDDIGQEAYWEKLGASNGNKCRCSHCGSILDMDGVDAGHGEANYCPKCGAQMDLKK